MPFPVIFVFIVLIGIFGSLQGPSSINSEPTGEVIISTPSGGLAKSTRAGSNQTISRPVSDSFTEPEPEEEQPVPSPEPVRTPPKIDTLSAQNVEISRVLLRGGLTFPDELYRGKAYFIYSRNFTDLVTPSTGVNQVLVSNSADESKIYFRTLSGLSDNTTYHYRFCFDDGQVRCGDIVSFTTVEDFDRDGTFRTPSVNTRPAINIDANSATLEGNYRRYDATNAVAFFVYGEDEDVVSEVSELYDYYQDIRELDERLQKMRVGVNIADRGEYSREVDELERDTEYFFSLCVAYDDDEATGIKCGSTRSFETQSRQRDIPTIRSTSASISGTTVTLSASLSMQDYLDGHAFLVYGTDETRIQSVVEEDRFSRVRQDEDAIQKISLETDFDGSKIFTTTVRDLLGETYHYRFCIEYQALNYRGYEELRLSCGSVNSFSTQ